MNKGEFNITKTVSVRKGKIRQGTTLIYSAEGNVKLRDFLKQSYRHLNIQYPKFHKMDDLCKLGILAAKVLLEEQDIPLDTALVFSNAASSLETDRKHQESMAGMVSPAVFVYTLPNIVAGEISIRHQLQSENAFFIEEKLNASLLVNYSEALLNTGKAAAVVCGWIDLKNDEYDVFLSLISKEGEIPFSEEKLEQQYLFENE